MPVTLLRLLDRYKYTPECLLDELKHNRVLDSKISELLGPKVERPEWPMEMRNPRAAVIGLLAGLIGGIQDPALREGAFERLLEPALFLGYSKEMVLMLSVLTGEIERDPVAITQDVPFSE